MRRADEVRVVWEPERLYWSVLHAPGWKRRGPLPEGLHPELEAELPLPPGEVHAVCAPLGDGRVVVCAAARAALAAVPAGTAALTPAALPACINAVAEPAALNLLVGEFEPAHLRWARGRRHALAAALLVLCAGLIAAGMLRRAEHWASVARRARDAGSALAAGAVPQRADDPHSLLTELTRLRASASAAARVRPPVDAAPVLAEVLRAWPAAVTSRPQSLSISPGAVTISVNLDGDPAPFLSALKPPAGWTILEPRLNATGGITRATLQFEAPGGQGRAAP